VGVELHCLNSATRRIVSGVKMQNNPFSLNTFPAGTGPSASKRQKRRAFFSDNWLLTSMVKLIRNVIAHDVKILPLGS
jgi:hypothetical protein